MKISVSLFILLVIECARIVQCYPNGAPSSTCGSMMPSHGTNSMSCQSNYVIEATKYQYNSDDSIQITVRGTTSSDRFKGILLVAKGQSSQNILGSWSSIYSSVYVVSCDGTSSNGITQAASTTKSQIQATWTSPSTTAQENIVISYQQSCEVPMARHRLGNDHVFVCQRLNDDTIQLQRFINPGGYSSPTIVTIDSNYGGILTVTRVALNNGVAYCEFTLSNFTTTMGRRRKRSISLLSQSTQYRILVATGHLAGSNALVQHSSVAVLTQKIQLDQSGTIATTNIEGSDDDKAMFLRAHGIIMLFIWILFVPTGILIARYFKQSWPTRKLCGKQMWFAVHRSVMIFAAIMTLIAFAAILKYNQGTWVSQNESHEFAHSIIGMLVISAAIIQPTMALFRCHPDHQYRFIFNYVHAIVGIGALILSIIAIFLATLFSLSDTSINKPWRIVVAWESTEFAILIGFECLEIFYRKKWSPFCVKNRDKPVQMNVLHNGSDATPVDDRSSPENILKERLKTFLLAIHILVAFGLSLTLAYCTWQAS
ncbi:unnamed protein product [Rotaria sp. Silwood2]|nr:unnamed protein product [Rotaria sp. Silwood2]CAF4170214.1 unnamed protein product [Rotaria sp. Silwood2]